MTAAAPLLPTPTPTREARPEPRDERPHEDHFVHLREATWADYERLLEIRGDRAVPRISFFQGTLEIMSPARRHESIKSVIGCLVEVFCLERGIEFSTYGSWTVKDESKESGAEPDECYVFGVVDEPKRPDLAIEVIWTSGGIDKLAIYQRLGVAEVWYYKKGHIQPYRLVGDAYEAAEKSVALPAIDLDQLVTFLDRPTTSQAIRDYRAALGPASE